MRRCMTQPYEYDTIIRTRFHMPRTSLPQDQNITCDIELDTLLDQIFQVRSFDFRDYKKASLKRRLKKRLDFNQILTYPEYAEFLNQHPEEYEKLFATLLINVTEFFRDPEAWSIIEKDVLPEIISRKVKGNSIRIWSAACASGEEAYTIGILLLEKLGDASSDFEIKIYATDIDEDTLSQARSGIYPEEKVKMISPAIIEKYFTKEDDIYRINQSVRQLISFGRLDLTADAPIPNVDLLVCRNVLMYFNNNLQNKQIHKFNFAVRNGGHIFLGKSEGILLGSKLYKVVDNRWKVYQKISGAGDQEPIKKLLY